MRKPKWKLRMYQLVMLFIILGAMIISKFTNIGGDYISLWYLFPILFGVAGALSRGYEDNPLINFILLAGTYMATACMYELSYLTMTTLYFVIMWLVYVIYSVLITIADE